LAVADFREQAMIRYFDRKLIVAAVLLLAIALAPAVPSAAVPSQANGTKYAFLVGCSQYTAPVIMREYKGEWLIAKAAAKPAPEPAGADPLIAGLKFVRVPKGTFWTGGGTYWDDAENKIKRRAPVKQVTMEADFELAAYTVTQEQWEKVMGKNPSWFSRQGGGKDQVKDISDAELKRFPVEQVSWNDAQDFLGKLNERERGKGWTYRMPTEAQWEYACRNAATDKTECSFDYYFERGTNDLSSNHAGAGKSRSSTSRRRCPDGSGSRTLRAGPGSTRVRHRTRRGSWCRTSEHRRPSGMSFSVKKNPECHRFPPECHRFPHPS
jgi:formylglycine-generating enzyme required for sulfatase activity